MLNKYNSEVVNSFVLFRNKDISSQTVHHIITFSQKTEKMLLISTQ